MTRKINDSKRENNRNRKWTDDQRVKRKQNETKLYRSQAGETSEEERESERENERA